MARIPTAPLLLGLAGLVPFLWGATTSPQTLSSYFPQLPFVAGTELLIAYGIVILSFMAGVIWGFAAKADGPFMVTGLTLSVVPALWIFYFTGQPAATQLLALIAGFAGLLAIDYACHRQGLTPPWWMALRVLLTGIVLFCLTIGYLFAP